MAGGQGIPLLAIAHSVFVRIEGQYNVWCIKNRTKLSNVLLLSLVRILLHQTLGSIWNPPEPSDVPYSPNQSLLMNYFCCSLQKDGSNRFLQVCYLHARLVRQPCFFETLDNYAMIDVIMSKLHSWQFLCLQGIYC